MKKTKRIRETKAYLVQKAYDLALKLEVETRSHEKAQALLDVQKQYVAELQKVNEGLSGLAGRASKLVERLCRIPRWIRRIFGAL